MNEGIIEKMRGNSLPRTPEQAFDSIREALQKAMLAALSTTSFYDFACFHGGTATRIFHGLGRFSEDLDFNLLDDSVTFDWNDFYPSIRKTMAELGIADCELHTRRQSPGSRVLTSFFAVNAQEAINLFYPEIPRLRTQHNRKLTIKFEINLNVVPYATDMMASLDLPFSCKVRVEDLETLFAGKLCACLDRNWKGRVKGRDFYDLLFFLESGIVPNVAHFKAKRISSGHMDEAENVDRELILSLLDERFRTIDWDLAREDVETFVLDDTDITCWDAPYFSRKCHELLKVE